MRSVKIGKVTLSIAAGAAADRLEKSIVLAERLTGRKAARTVATRRARTFRVRKGSPVGLKVTLRDSAAKEFLKKLLPALDNKLKASSFDDEGNFAFGIHEYLDIPGVKYDPELGILGMNVVVTLERAGWRVKRRKIAKSKIGRSHRISADEAQAFAKRELGECRSWRESSESEELEA